MIFSHIYSHNKTHTAHHWNQLGANEPHKLFLGCLDIELCLLSLGLFTWPWLYYILGLAVQEEHHIATQNSELEHNWNLS